MDGVYTQDGNLGRVETGLGKDHLLLVRFSGTDKVNDLFEYRLRVLARNGLDYDALLGTHATVFLHTISHGEAPFDGVVTEVEWMKGAVGGDEYELVLRPWFWLAGKRRQQRIFHDKSVDEILEQVLSQWSGLGDATHRLALTNSYPKLEYTVQYRESDLAFACRLMERFGISFHFEQAGGNHCLVLTDGHEAMGELPGRTREFRPVEEFYRKDEEHFWEWRRARGITTGKVKLTDYNFKTPTSNMLTEQAGDAAHAHGEIESYDYPGVYPDAGEGADVAALRVTQERAGDHRTRAAGDVISLKAGMRCAVEGEFAAFTAGEEHLCLEAHHEFTAEAYRSSDTAGGDSEGERAYEGRYLFIPVSAPFAPARKTPQPVVQGPQTARVVGEGEIDCDEYGRILVRFHWDLEDAYSMRCRVSQNWAGKGWGGMVIPRIGMEVVVEFLEGDPDKPLVTGCVYNGKNDVPYELPANKTRSTFKTDTHQGDGFNELRFEDQKGSEEIFLHAERDRNEKTRNNHTERIDNNWVQSVGHNKASEVNNNRIEVVGGDAELRVGPGQRNAVAPDVPASNIAGISGLGDSFGANGGGPKGSGSYYVSIEQDKSQIIGRDASDLVRNNKAVEVRGDMRTVVDGTVLIDAGKKLTLNCGAVSIVMESNGSLTINGKKATVTMDRLIALLADMVKIN
ncbi:type VI secretion system Vgr family protein [Oceanicola sp. 502str15]|uniref:type VI secretion system Vgr family protein n=1 Tax=Oceanicola sp. 502str15 TaxID=2696061 RepID=UPI00209417EF|nr:type VI secretion system tip protein TssI/VgrG [Oceanicola sp. 502str15]MCO6383325.1 type VI secretion system tip protein VgrG [Oceanicola sp. 502str15]